MATPQDILYFAIRETHDGKEWIDIETWGYVAQTAQDKAKETDKALPQWAEHNQVKRIAAFRLTETASPALAGLE